MNKPPITSKVQLPLLIVAAVFFVVVLPMLNAFGYV